MAKVNYLKNRFISGELTPKLSGRADLPVYQNGCQTLENFHPIVHGGVTRRPGMKYVNEVKDSNKAVRLIPFIYSTTTAYMMEFGHQYIRIYGKEGVVQTSSAFEDIRVIASAPAAPTVNALTTPDSTPLLTGTVSLSRGNKLEVTVNSVTYTCGDGNLSYNPVNFTWRLQIPNANALANGTYSVVAKVITPLGTYSTDPTSSELVVNSAASQPLTIDTPVLNSVYGVITGKASLNGESLTATVQYSTGARNINYDDYYMSFDGINYTIRPQAPHAPAFASGPWTLIVNKVVGGLYGRNTVIESISSTITVDNIFPAKPVINKQVTTTHTPLITGTVNLFSGDSFKVVINTHTYYLGDGTLYYNHAAKTWDLRIPSGDIAADGTYSIVATVTDASGNASITTEASGLVIGAPTASLTTVTGMITADTTPTIVGTASCGAGETLWVTINGRTYIAGDGNLTYTDATKTWSLTIPGGDALADGTYKCVATVVNSSNVQVSVSRNYVDITTTYTEAELFDITCVQEATTMYICHQNHAPATLTRTSDIAWTLANISFTGLTLSEYPAAVTMFEQRLVLGGTTTEPQTFWASKNGSRTNFTVGTNDDDGMKVTLSTDRGAPIQHLLSTKLIMALTYGMEMTIAGSMDKPISPTNLQIRSATAHGSSAVKPIKIGGEVLFVQRGSTKLRALAYEFTTETYMANDLTVMSDHISEIGFKELAYSQEPYSIIWGVLNDGSMVSCTYDKNQQINAWARHITDGRIESVAVMPNGAQDQVWVIVKRNIGSITKRYVEVLDYTVNTDCCFVGIDNEGRATWVDLWPIEGRTVDVVADGAVMTQQVVTDGAITIDRDAYVVEIGLHYDSTLRDMPIEINTPTGSAFGSAVSVHEVDVNLYESMGLTINGETVSFRSFGLDNFDPVTPFTGSKRIANVTGWEDRGVVEIKQVDPLPCTILSIVKKVTVND